MAEIFTLFYHYQIVLNLYHFQTKSYAGHKASDKHLERFREHFDGFLEVYQGIFGKIKFLRPHNIQVHNISKTKQITDITLELNKYLVDLAEELEDHGDLVNIIDEIIADNNQFLYLLTFD